MRKASDLEIETPITSMIDIVFLLIIFFLVTTNFMNQKGIRLELPNTEKSEETADQKKKNIELRVTSSNFLLNDEKVADGELEKQVNKALKDAANDADKIVIMKSDKGAPYDRFILANDILQKTQAIITIEVTEGDESATVKKEEIKKVNVKGDIEAKMKEAEEDDGDGPPEGLEEPE